MVTNLVTLSPQMHVLAGMSRLLKQRITGAPVIDDARTYLGVFSEKSCLRLLIDTAPPTDADVATSPLTARDIMATRLVALGPDRDAYEAIGYLLAHRISGAPVVDAERRFLGIFSEKTSMSVLVSGAYEQLPTARVGAFMNPDKDRVIDEEMPLHEIIQIFLETPYRRLSVLREDRLVGQISRSDVLRAQHHLAANVKKLAAGGVAAADVNSPLAGAEQSRFDVATYMDREAQTISPNADLLDIAQVFLHTPYRRLPVIRDNRLLGQVSRRDLLAARFEQLAIVPQRKRSLLYLSSVSDSGTTPID